MARALSPSRWQRLGSIAYVAFPLAGFALLLWMAIRWLGGPDLAPDSLRVTTIAAAAAAYLLGHLFRIARLALIIGDQRLSLRQLVAVHLFTSSVILGVPFKLGELYRIGELSTVTFSKFGALVVAWVERCFDIGLLLLLLLIALAISPARTGDYWPVMILSLVFVIATLVIVTLVPDNLRRLGNHIIRRYDADWTIDALKGIARARRLFQQSSRMVQGRLSSLAVCTVIIWALEATSLTIILTSHGQGQTTVDMMMSFLSMLVRGETLLTQLGATARDGATMLSAYLLATQVPLLIAGLASGGFLLSQRLRASYASSSRSAA